MTKLSDLDFYTSPWLTVADLGGKPRRVTICEWTVKEVQQRDGTKARKVALSFNGKYKRLLCNVTQAKAAAAAWGEQLEGWVGKQCILQPGVISGKETILLVVPPAAQPAGFRPVQPGALQPEAPGEPQPPAAAPEPPAAHPEPGERAPMTEEEAAALWVKEPA